MTNEERRRALRESRSFRATVRKWSGNGVTTRDALVVHMDIPRLPLKSAQRVGSVLIPGLYEDAVDGSDIVVES